MKETLQDILKERGFSLKDFELGYETCIDNYNLEYNCDDAENHSDFLDYCLENWS